MKILIYEPDYTGHRLTYVRLLTTQLLRLPVSVHMVLGASAADTIQYTEQIKSLEGRAKITCEINSASGSAERRAWHKLNEYQATLDRHKPDHVLIPYIDGMAQTMAIANLLGILQFQTGIEQEGLLMRSAFAYPLASWKRRIRARVSAAMIRRCGLTRLHVLDPLGYEWMHDRWPEWSNRMRVMPDPVEPMPSITREKARELLGIPIDGQYLGTVGGMDRRKGIDLLLRAFKAANRPPSDRLLLVGHQEQAIRELVQSEYKSLVSEGRLICFDRYVSNNELDYGVLASDVIATPYPEHVGSASIVIRAAAAGRPVLGSDYGWIGYSIAKHHLGKTCPVRDTSVFVATINNFFDNSSIRAGFYNDESMRAFANSHTTESFGEQWTVRIRERLKMT